MADEFEHLKVTEFEHWAVYVNEDQSYLGRLVVWYKYDEPLDIFDIPKDHQKEYWQVMKTTRDVLRKTFGADMLNYATLQNVTHHIHTHVIPRYSKTITLFDHEFTDPLWGDDYKPRDSVEYPEDVIQQVKTKLQASFPK